MEATLEGTIVHGFGRTLGRSLAVMLIGIPLIATAPVLLEEGGYISEPLQYGLFTVGLVAVMALMLNEMWTRGALKVKEDGLVARQRRLLQLRPHTHAWPWASIASYRFDTDPQGRPYVQVMPKGEADVSCYGSASAVGQEAFAAFEAVFRAAVAQANEGVIVGGAVDAATPADGAPIVEAPSFYAARWVRVGSVVLVAGALVLTVTLFATGSDSAWRSLWMLLLVLGFAARVWLPRTA